MKYTSELSWARGPWEVSALFVILVGLDQVVKWRNRLSSYSIGLAADVGQFENTAERKEAQLLSYITFKLGSLKMGDEALTSTNVSRNSQRSGQPEVALSYCHPVTDRLLVWYLQRFGAPSLHTVNSKKLQTKNDGKEKTHTTPVCSS